MPRRIPIPLTCWGHPSGHLLPPRTVTEPETAVPTPVFGAATVARDAATPKNPAPINSRLLRLLIHLCRKLFAHASLQPRLTLAPPQQSSFVERRATVVASCSPLSVRVSSPLPPLPSCIFLSSNYALEAENRKLPLADNGAAIPHSPPALFRRGSLSLSPPDHI